MKTPWSVIESALREWSWWMPALTALDLFLIGKVSPATVAESLVCAGFATAGLAFVRRRAKLSFRWKAGHIWGSLLFAVRSVIPDLGRVFPAVTRSRRTGKPLGAFRTLSWAAGGSSPEDTARRALLVESVSFAPNTYVVAIDPAHGRVLVHQLVPTPGSPIPRLEGDAS